MNLNMKDFGKHTKMVYIQRFLKVLEIDSEIAHFTKVG